jgi:signal transduction histidine kinase
MCQVVGSDRERSLLVITDKIRRSLDLETILATTTQEALDLLGADRVVVYRFNDDWSGEFIAEAVTAGWTSLLELQAIDSTLRDNVSECSAKDLGHPKTTDTWLQATKGEFVAKGEIYRVQDNVYTAGFTDCYLKVLESYQAKAYVIVAIYRDTKIWGLLAAYQNAAPRHWQADEVNFLIHIGTQLGVAVQQAELLEATRRQARVIETALQDLQQAQLQLVQSEKLSSIGQLVAGIAHELNNPINFIAGNVAHVAHYVQELLALLQSYRAAYPHPDRSVQQQAEAIDLAFLQEDLPRALASIKSGSDRVTQLVRALRSFARLDEAEQKTVDIHQGLEGALLMVQYRLKPAALGYSITIQQQFQELPYVECYPARLNQVFLAILSYSIDRIGRYYPQQPDMAPQITITTHRINDDRISICIAHNLPYSSELDESNLFDPSKMLNQSDGVIGGLGLPMSYQIITDLHHGLLYTKASSTPQGNTEFWIELPIKL